MDPIDIKLKELWEAGKTGGEIAEAFGTTRSAIMGRVHRLRKRGVILAERPAIKRTKQQVEAARLSSKVVTMPFVMPKYSAKPKPARKKKPDPAQEIKKEQEPVKEVLEFVAPEPVKKRGPKTILTLGAFDCRWIRPDKKYCGELAKSARTPWCEEHYKLVYVPRTKAKVSAGGFRL